MTIPDLSQVPLDADGARDPATTDAESILGAALATLEATA